MKVLHENGLAPYHTFGIDVSAKYILEASSVEDLLAIWQDETYQEVPKLVVGQGSNLLFCEDYQGAIILNRIKGINVVDSAEYVDLHVGGGEDWHAFVSWAVENGFNGLENLALIPGCVGSSPIQNIGAYGVELKDVCQYVDVLNVQTGEVKRLMADECHFSYRDSIFKRELKDNHIITAVGFRLTKAWSPKIAYGPLAKFSLDTVTAKDIFDEVCAIRREKLPDPQVMGNAGSFFKNPIISLDVRDLLLSEYPNMPSYPVDEGHCKLAAGWLIDQCGLKGYQIGGAKIHQQQALVLTNVGNATAHDVLQLAKYVVDTVMAKFGVSLEHEVRFMAHNAETNLIEMLR
ncbi:UDP-N-acetylmuramate dehydrogenase [Photobacterium angustum]|uniref:UDP-N-acetylenolpyruvoylglucosamine reductase n=1 Tax=Photobacterium angustum TaxID=661 RepID=A0A855S9Q3_PHOAN|nr:UDP-N-acetylmuramate dehydrogenase [Photobacterium angustum]KJF79596.1 UDP-N-acetylenolpyruvoylglucosamine reductase [Photobacterium damselae subsp. damselae]KJG26930.1 UDP-N-acetylenolpyruvoylglucosamine reductase [Photobacterium angustum]KJG35187.1 UDP-N-acetylenolpyruvoylglucosamine reductase [Photobacterium angustum]KJG42379.1 UDP-N-acetylenolpyruvoylglucosamine reductase [Photobacterium angustum]KJG44104.1 UDP-N-acetylenolpyruvoylglucosamine reductase [Photobacterium angustum]